MENGQLPMHFRLELIHAGKANNVYKTNTPGVLELESSDRVSAGNGEKTDTITNKGIANNQISTATFQYLESHGIPTHYICEGNNQASKIVREADMIPLEVICRFFAVGSFCKRYGVEKGKEFNTPFVEYTFKNDKEGEAGDPPIDRETIIAIPEVTKIYTRREIGLLDYYTERIGYVLRDFYTKLDVTLVDFKVEYGRLPSGEIILCDEISPDTCRLLDNKTGESLDKDRFRNDLGDVSKGYNEILARVRNVN